MRDERPEDEREKASQAQKQAVSQAFSGYRRANKTTRAEEREWAMRLTLEESRRVFEELYLAWEQTGAHTGGDWAAVERARTEESLRVQRKFVRLARRAKSR
jgi:hypothetical protein